MIYFDNSATTKMSERARNKMLSVSENIFGNPSSLHKVGVDAEREISRAREIIATSLGILRPQRWEIVFTSGGTESNNLAIFGVINAKKRQGNEKIMITDSEHSSVEECALYLEKQGYQVLRVPTKGGELDFDFIEKNANGVILASLMHVNNETGALYDVARAFDIIREKSPICVCHSDCVQSYLKVKFTKKSLGADLISISAHKVNGPKGVGALYIAPEILKTKKIVPIILGGGQEGAYRSGTENTYGICAFGEAVKEHTESLREEIEKMRTLREYIFMNMPKEIKVKLPVFHAPHILNITMPKIKSETVLHDLSAKGIFVSSGSACASNSTHKASRALVAFGVSEDEADTSIRISLSPENTKEEANALISALSDALSRLARKS
jgi:cysteine desulfurase